MLKVRKEFTLSGDEKDILARMPEVGARLIENIPRLDNGARIILYQNKHFDGSGFPSDSVRGDEIPGGARILEILSDLIGCEEQGMSRFNALVKMRATEGLYDPEILQTIIAHSEVALDKQRESLPIELHELRVGDVLASDIETSEGLKLVGVGTIITRITIEKVHNFSRIGGIKKPIFVED